MGFRGAGLMVLAVVSGGCGSSDDGAAQPAADAAADVTADGTAEAGDGFEPYFNGSDLDGFEFVGITSASVSVADGVLKCSGQPHGYFYRNEVLRNFVLKLEFLFVRPAGLAPGDDASFSGNSGYFVYLTPPHEVWPRCLEVQGSYPETGDIFGLPGLTHANDQLDTGALATAKKPVGEWNALVIESQEGALKVELNGLVVNQSTPTDLSEGLIALESEGAEIHWRNMLIKRLP